MISVCVGSMGASTYTRDLIHGLHPGTQDHPPHHTRRSLSGEQLPPCARLHVLRVEDIFDDRELRPDGRRVDSRTVALKRSENLIRLIVLAFSDEQSR